MIRYTTVSEIQNSILIHKKNGLSIGFVPTMGALHQGHLSLINKAKQENDIVICSIFVNPTQFNNKEDFEKYPHTEDTDIELLTKENCNIVFIPSEKEIYPSPINIQYDFGNLDKVMEGKYRPGHFQGVANVVNRLFEIIKPNRAYFGEKDFQQLAIIKELCKQFFPYLIIVPCPIVRERDGLAMSSRNMRLTPEERLIVPIIYKTLLNARAKANDCSVSEVKAWVVKQIENQPHFKLEYFEISDINTLKPINNWTESQNSIACIAVFVGKVRLIDNIIIERKKVSN